MSVEIVNPVPAEAIPAWSSAMAVTFLGDPANPDSPRRQAMLRSLWEPERAWGARDGADRWVATLRTEARSLTVPGPGASTAVLSADAVTNVTVAATHTRRGLLRGMLGASMSAAHERGDALSVLIAAEWPIYGRFGYAPATQSAHYLLRRMLPGSRVPGDVSRVRLVERDDFAAVAPAVFEVARRGRAGQIDRGGTWYGRQLGEGDFAPSPALPVNLLVHDGDGGPDGLLGWTASGDDFSLIPPFGSLNVTWFSAASEAAYRDLWAYLTTIDLVGELTLKGRPVDEPARWLLPDARTLVTTQVVDFLWVRLLDVPAALSARGYATAGELVLEIVDEDVGGFAAGRYRLTAAADGRGACAPDRAEPQLTLGQRALASIYLGGFTPRQLMLGGQIVEHTPGAVDHLGAMFATPMAPWCATWF